MEPPKKLLIFPEGTVGARKTKKTLSEKNYCLKLKKFLIFFPKNFFLIFQEWTCKARKTKISSISL